MLALIYIEARFRDPISLEDIARASHVSRFHFARAFRAETGMSTMQYVRWRRVHEAKRLLRTGGIPLATIATDLGYFDQSHFTRAFRSVTGLRPHEYLNGVARPELINCSAKLLSWRIESNSRIAQAHIVREVALGLILVEPECVE
ncbi:helix-turn-helix transcriptional regulator [Pseudoxanthomonas sp. Root65]|uniref:helix-turn-helix transcriptional regulator n=1 Tax=Pseudoxanthomonas sp. Root65 TaxID=1736576 RepID=UPI00138F555D|nr:helix-turn-helix transcriptional regulator [Pseudoxanthomonas sp. Root65]